jgi:hypothetical protein
MRAPGELVTELLCPGSSCVHGGPQRSGSSLTRRREALAAASYWCAVQAIPEARRPNARE